LRAINRLLLDKTFVVDRMEPASQRHELSRAAGGDRSTAPNGHGTANPAGSSCLRHNARKKKHPTQPFRRWHATTRCGIIDHGAQFCVIFATLGKFFPAATVQNEFSASMSRIYYSKWGSVHAHRNVDCRPSMDQRGRRAMKSPVVKRSIVVAGHKTSVSLEDAFWKGLKEIAGGRDVTLSDLVATIDSERQHGNLSSAIRLFVLDFYRKQLSDMKQGNDGTHEMMARAASACA